MDKDELVERFIVASEMVIALRGLELAGEVDVAFMIAAAQEYKDAKAALRSSKVGEGE